MQDETLAIILVLPHVAMCVRAMHTRHSLSPPAYLTQTDRLQPGRGCTRQPSLHLRSCRASEPKIHHTEEVRQCGASEDYSLIWIACLCWLIRGTRSTLPTERSESILEETGCRPF